MKESKTANERLNTIKWSDIFIYTKESITFLKWKHKRVARNGYLVNRSRNNQAGSVNSDGFLTLGYEKQSYSLPKIIWVMHNGPLPEDFSVFFRDHNHLNTAIENLYIKETNLKLDKKYSEDLKKYIAYDESSPSCLRWIDRCGKGSTITINSCAGSFDKSDNYWKIHGLGHHYKAHRLVWFLLNGSIPKGMSIDHINGVRSDNRIANLRVVTHHMNSMNRSKSKNNTTGVNGVCYYEGYNSRGTLIQKYTATFADKAFSKKSRAYSCVKYGKEEALRLAIEWRQARIKELNEQGSGYTDRHGT